MCRQTVQLRVEEEPIVPMVESVPIYHHNVMYRCGQHKKYKMLRNKGKLNKLLKGKYLLDKNDLTII
jgi:hypothetical protein